MPAMLTEPFMPRCRRGPGCGVGKVRTRPHNGDWLHSAIAYSPQAHERTDPSRRLPARYALPARWRPAAGDHQTGGRVREWTGPPDPAGRHRLGQDLHHRQRLAADTEADYRDGSEQDARRAVVR